MPCPPLVPISIIPPVSQGVAPILWRNGNQITRLNIPLNPSFLIYDGTKTRWGDGSAQAPVYLPNIQEVNSPAVTYVAGITSTGQLVKTLGASGTALVGGSAGSVVYQTAPSATGFTAVGTAGQLLSSNGASAPTWLNQSAIAAGSATTAATATTANTLTTARTISISGDVTGTATSFNGSANITIPVTINAGAVTPADLSTGGPSWDGSGNLTKNGNLTQTRTSADYNVVTLTNTSGVEVQLNANGNSEGNLITTTNHPLSLSTNSVTRLNISTTGVIDTQANPITNCLTTAKAWGGASSAGVINPLTFGVSTITRFGLGVYIVTMSTAINGYSIVATPDTSAAPLATAEVLNTTQFIIYTATNAGARADFAFKFAVFGV